MEAAPIPGGVTAVATVPVPAVPTTVLLLFPRPQDCGSHPTGGGSARHLTGCAAESCPPHHAADSTGVGARAVGPIFGEGDAEVRLLPGLSGFA